MDPVLEQLLYGSIPGRIPQGDLRPKIKPWIPRPNVTLGPDLQFHPVEPVQSPEDVVKGGFAKVMGLPRELMNEGAREVGLIGEDQTVGSRLAQDILRPDSELGAYIQEQAGQGDRLAKDYIAGVEGATEGLVDPLNIALAPIGGPGAMAMMAAGLPSMAEGVKQAAESPETDREANLIRTVAGIAAPVGLGAMFGAGHEGGFGTRGREIEIPNLQTQEFVPPTLNAPEQAISPVGKFEPAPEALPTLGEETRIQDAIKAVKAIESAQANPTTELNTSVWTKNVNVPDAMEPAMDIMQSPGALKAKSFMDALHSVTGKGNVNLGIRDSSAQGGGWLQGFQGSPDAIGAANPDINIAPAAIAHRIIEIGTPREQIVSKFYDELGRTVTHEGTHSGQKVPGAEGPVDNLMHGQDEFGTLQIGDEAPETLTESQAFDFVDSQRQAEFRGARENLAALHQSGPDALTIEDILDLAGRHQRYYDILGSPAIQGQTLARVSRTGFSPVESLAEPVTLSEKLRVAGARDLLDQSQPYGWGPSESQIESFNLQDVPAEDIETVDASELNPYTPPKRLVHVPGTGEPYPLHWDAEGNPVLGLNPKQAMHTNAERPAVFGGPLDPQYTFKPKFTNPIEVTDPGGGWNFKRDPIKADPTLRGTLGKKFTVEDAQAGLMPESADAHNLDDSVIQRVRAIGHDPVLKYRNQFENYGYNNWMQALQSEMRELLDTNLEAVEGFSRYVSELTPDQMQFLSNRLAEKGIYAPEGMEESYLVGRPNELLEPESFTGPITETPLRDDINAATSKLYDYGDKVYDPADIARHQTLRDEVIRAEGQTRYLRRTDIPPDAISVRAEDGSNLQDIPAPNVSEDAIDAARLLRNAIKEGSVTDQAAWTESLPDHLQPHAADIWESVSDYVKVNENPANLLSGEKLAKLTPEQLKTFGRLATMDPAEVLATAHDPVEAAKLIIAAKHPGSPAETKALLAQQLMQQHGIKAPTPPPPAPVPPAKSPLGPNRPPKVETVEDYVGLKQALNVKQDLTARDFEHLRQLGPQGLKDFEANPKSHPELQKFFDEMLKYQRDYGVPVSELPNYLPHLYEGTPAQLKAYAADITRQMNKLGLRPGHTLARKLASYDIAEKVYGLKPKFDNLADLAGKYRYMAEKAVADRQLFDFAKRNNLISTVKKDGWVELPNFPVRHVETKAGTPVEIKYFGEPKFAKYINRALGQPSTVAQILSHITSFGRNITLGAGIPGTGWNGYGLILMNRYVKSAPNIAEGIGRVMHGIKDLTLTKRAGKQFEGILDRVPDAIEHGLNLSVEDRSFQPDKRGLKQRVSEAEPLKIGMPAVEESRVGGFALKKFGQLGELVSTFFDRPLTQRVAPLWKMAAYEKAVDHFTSKGLAPKQAKIKAAEWANTVMTGRNWQRMGSSPEALAWSRVFFLAPDILRSNIEMGKGVVKGLAADVKSPQAQLYRRYAGTAFTLFVAQQFLSKALTGRTAIDAPPGQAFNMYAGDLDKEHEIYIRPSLTADDWARLPFEIASAIASGDEKKPVELLRNRMSTLTNWAMTFMTQRNYAGVPLSGPGIPAGRAVLNNLEEASQLGTPPQLGFALEALKHVEPIGKFSKEMGFGRTKAPFEIGAGLVEAPISVVKKRKKKDEPIGLLDFHKSNRKKKGGDSGYTTDLNF